MTKGKSRAQRRRILRKIVNRVDLDMPNMSGKAVARVGYGAGLNRKQIAKREED